MECFQNLPKEIIDSILDWEGSVKFHHGKYANRICRNDTRYKLLEPIPTKYLEYMSGTDFTEKLRRRTMIYSYTNDDDPACVLLPLQTDFAKKFNTHVKYLWVIKFEHSVLIEYKLATFLVIDNSFNISPNFLNFKLISLESSFTA